MSDQLREQLRQREEEVVRLNKELEDTNRGVVALYAELDEKADFLRRASEIKTRFLANMSHEFRTPLNSIRSLARFLLDPADGPLAPEKEKQAGYILKAAESLAVLVNDLLDLAKVEAGKLEVRVETLDVVDLFGTLRGTFRPLLDPGSQVALVFEDASGLPHLRTDEGKVTQILRNFISNALKFTERGEVRVRAAAGPGDTIVFSVADTGIGIDPGDRDRIFEEFAQVDGPMQTRVKGTGLGLPLSRKLATLLGGGIDLQSTPGTGSRFELTLPRYYPGATANAASGERARTHG
jgi:signal transduction histidine kinase